MTDILGFLSPEMWRGEGLNEPSDDVSFILCSYWSEGLHVERCLTVLDDVIITMVKYRYSLQMFTF